MIKLIIIHKHVDFSFKKIHNSLTESPVIWADNLKFHLYKNGEEK